MNNDQHLTQLITDGRVKPCPKCNETGGLWIQMMDSGPNRRKIVCANCNDAYVAWAPKPGKRPPQRDGKTVGLMNIIRASWPGGPVYCLTCLRDDQELHQAGQWLEAHHVVEHQDGGTDHPSNLQPQCNVCHSLIHWRRKSITGSRAEVTEVAAPV